MQSQWPRRKWGSAREKHDVFNVNSSDEAADESASVFDQPQPMGLTRAAERNLAEHPVNPDDAPGRKSGVEDGVAAPDACKKIAVLEGVGFEFRGDSAGPVGKARIGCEHRSAFRVEFPLKRENPPEIKSEQPHPIGETAARYLT
jgi:hypothetical protein